MPGQFTHWMISEEAVNGLQPGPLRTIFENHMSLLLLGSVSPDLPYFSAGSKEWADRFHKEMTNKVPLAFLDSIIADGLDYYLNPALYSWVMGYISHMVADATIHPIVEKLIEDSLQKKDDHTISEMTQDSLVFYHFKGKELTDSEYSEIIKSCRDHDAFFLLMETWMQFIQAVYNAVDTLHPKEWFSSYVNGMDIAEGGRVATFSRQYGLVKKYLYSPAEKIIRDQSELYNKYYNEVALPGGGRGHFLNRGFYPAVANVIVTWQQIHEGIQSQQVVRHLVKNWDLDTGVDKDSPKKFRTYWPIFA